MDETTESLADHERHWLDVLHKALDTAADGLATAKRHSEAVEMQLAGFSAYLGWHYQLAPDDEVCEDGTIRRAVREDTGA